LARYEVENRITMFVSRGSSSGRSARRKRARLGHVYGYRVGEPVGERETDVTAYCDCGGLSEKWLAPTTWPIVPASAPGRSLENLDRLVTARPAG
jgi:hypothetical protein